MVFFVRQTVQKIKPVDVDATAAFNNLTTMTFTRTLSLFITATAILLANPVQANPIESLQSALRAHDLAAVDEAARGVLSALARTGGQPDLVPEMSLDWSDDAEVSAFVLSRDDGRSIMVVDVPRRFTPQQPDDVSAALAHELVHILSERFPPATKTDADWAAVVDAGRLPRITRFSPAAPDAFEAGLARHGVIDAADEAVADLLAIALSADAFGDVHAARVRVALNRFRQPARTDPVRGLSGLSYALAATVLADNASLPAGPLADRFDWARSLVFPRLLTALAEHPFARAEALDDGSRSSGFRTGTPVLRPRGEDSVLLVAVRRSGSGFIRLDDLLAVHGGLMSTVRPNGDRVFDRAVLVTTEALRSLSESSTARAESCDELVKRARALGQADLPAASYTCDQRQAVAALIAMDVFNAHRQRTHEKLLIRINKRQRPKS